MTDYRLNDLTAIGDCVICGKKQLEGGLPMFFCLEVTRACFDPNALRRAAGFEMAMGALAAVLGPDEVLAKSIEGPKRVFVHEACAGKVAHLVQLLEE